MPYQVKAFLPYKNIPLSVIRLEKGYARVMHNSSGLTLTDTINVDIAYDVCRSVFLSLRNRRLKSAFSKLTWEKYRSYKKDGKDIHAKVIHKFISEMSIPGIVSPEETDGLRFKHRPEFIR